MSPLKFNLYVTVELNNVFLDGDVFCKIPLEFDMPPKTGQSQILGVFLEMPPNVQNPSEVFSGGRFAKSPHKY